MTINRTCSALLFSLSLVSCTSGGGGGTDPTPTPTPTPIPGTVGCRPIAVSTGKDGNAADNSTYITTALSPGTDISEFLDANGWATGGMLTLCAGALTANKAPITLQQDVTFSISLPLSNCICRQYLATGTTGALYCGAHADAIDFTSRVDSNVAGAAGPEAIVDGAAVTAPGSVRVIFKSKVTNIDANAAACTPAACATALAAVGIEDAHYTTGTATSEFTNPNPAGTNATVGIAGRPFDDPATTGVDCEDWLTPGSIGGLAGAPGHDEDNPDAGNKDVVTIERISE